MARPAGQARVTVVNTLVPCLVATRPKLSAPPPRTSFRGYRGRWRVQPKSSEDLVRLAFTPRCPLSSWPSDQHGWQSLPGIPDKYIYLCFVRS
ncbi:hypothetical protein RRG08_064982 [Elysia crispata]|uniref:Uncharacterized protein n=1 Tax=Elysia crispata TaxID=231223 RepID=A0AAE0YA60_9GAST|nr:hypothetical protein RRG08_064982 [Elysia crispata]